MKYICVFDSWKGCMSSDEANLAARQGILDADPSAEVVCLRASDGGEGMLEAFMAAMGGQKISVMVHDPLMRVIKAEYGIAGDTAIIEVARACGLTLLSPEERNPMEATTYGVGEMVLDAYQRGCRQFIIGLGGSATSDAGIGMLQAIIHGRNPVLMGVDEVHNEGNHFVEPNEQNETCFNYAMARNGRMKSNDTFKTNFESLKVSLKQNFTNDSYTKSLLSDNLCRFILASDVKNPLFGDNGAAHVFAPQKGATPEMVAMLDHQARDFAAWSEKVCGYDKSLDPGAGAAGGLGYAFMQFLGAECRSGINLLLDACQFERLLSDTDYVITGEGAADRQTLMGKLPYGVMRRAIAMQVPTLLFSGKLSDEAELLNAGFEKAICINPPAAPLSEAIMKTVAMRRLREKVKEIARKCRESE